MFTGGIGQIDAQHTEKGMLIVQVGGWALSMLQGENAEELDFNAVQCGDAEMEQKMNRVIRAFYAAGFEPWDITMTDLLAGRVTLEGLLLRRCAGLGWRPRRGCGCSRMQGNGV